ncbi:hypothetical protein BG004_003309 [Podila humilis]|nr:hypothetical protein BG004_003309 [Podila humilis]
MSPTLFSSETPAPRGTLLSTELPTGLDSTLPTPPIGGDPSNPSTTKMSGTSGSPLAAILGAIVGVVALVGLIALILYRRRERKEERREAMGEDDGEEGVYDDRGNPSIREAPRTSFRHESFIALVKDAAQGLYAPSETTVPPGSVSANLAAASLDMSDSCAAAVVAGPDETGLVAVAAAECVKGGEDTGSELVRNDSAVSCHTSAGTLEYLESPASCPHLQAIDPS